MGEINYKSIFKLAIPIVIQNFIFASLQIIDSFMIVGVGEKALAAVTISSQVYFFIFIMTFGASSGASVFISQYFGAKDFKGIKKTLALNISFSTVISFLVFLVAFFFSKEIIGLFTNDTEVLMYGVRYLKITSFSYVIIAIAFPYELALRSITLAKASMIVTSIAVVINTVLNYILIYGKFGFSAMGVDGAATATLIARLIELALVVYIIYIRDKSIGVTFSDIKSLDFSFVKKIYKVAYPVLLNEILWGMGTIFYLFIFAKYGSKLIVGYQIAYQFYLMIEALMIGFALASQVMIGNAIGELEYEKANELASVYLKIIVVLAVVSTVIMFAVYAKFLTVFNLPSDTNYYAEVITIVVAIFNLPRFLGILFVVGILRGGGDTKYAFYLEVLSMWVINIPILYVAVVFLNVSFISAIVILHIQEIIKSVVGYYRYKTKKWINNVIE